MEWIISFFCVYICVYFERQETKKTQNLQTPTALWRALHAACRSMKIRIIYSLEMVQIILPLGYLTIISGLLVLIAKQAPRHYQITHLAKETFQLCLKLTKSYDAGMVQTFRGLAHNYHGMETQLVFSFVMMVGFSFSDLQSLNFVALSANQLIDGEYSVSKNLDHHRRRYSIMIILRIYTDFNLSHMYNNSNLLHASWVPFFYNYCPTFYSPSLSLSILLFQLFHTEFIMDLYKITHIYE